MNQIISVLVFSLSTAVCAAASEPVGASSSRALDASAIQVERLDSILDYALLLGNGDINALVWSEQGRLIVTLSKNDVWDARLDSQLDPPLPTLDLIKKLATQDAPQRGGRSTIRQDGWGAQDRDSYHAHPYPCPRACGRLVLGDAPAQPASRRIRSEGGQDSLRIGGGDRAERRFALVEFRGPGAEPSADRKAESAAASPAQLDLRRAVVRAAGAPDGTPQAEIRALADRNVFWITSSAQASLEPMKSSEIPEATAGEHDGVQWLEQEIPGDLDWPGMRLAVALASRQDVKAAALVTSREAEDPRAAAITLAKSTVAAEPGELVRAHEAQWARFWSASSVEIDEAELQTMWYRSLYFLRCVSKPGSIAPGLFAGLIHDRPAWHGDYHTNYNIQQTFWAAFGANHVELAEPYFRLIRDYLPRARWLARQVFSSRGAYFPHVLFAYEPPNPAQCRSPNGRQYLHHVWGFTIGVSGFTVQPLWWGYKYAPSRELLENTAYPAVRDVAEFYADFIEQCEGGQPVVLAPSVSPEHWGWTKGFDRNRNSTFDIAMIRYTLDAAIEGAQALSVDEERVARWREALSRLPQYPTTTGDSPIVVDVQDAPPIQYNIAAPAVPVFPGDVVTWRSPLAERELFARTIDQLKWNGNNSAIILSVARARLSMPRTLEWVRNELMARQRPNGTLTLNRRLPPKAINDFGHYTEQFAASMAVSELLLQSVGDVIRVFPAWPADRDARFRDLRAQGGFLVSAQQSGGKTTRLEITSTAGGTLRLLSPWPGIRVRRDSGAPLRVALGASGLVQLDTSRGEQFSFEPSSPTDKK